MARRRVGDTGGGGESQERLDDAARACADGLVGDPSPEVLARELGLTPVIPEKRLDVPAAAGDISNAVKGLFGTPAPEPETVPYVDHYSKAQADLDAIGEEITVTRGEEMYGQQGSFSSYRVGPLALKTTVRAGENHVTAAARALADLDKIAEDARARAKASFMEHFPKAFK